MFAEDEEGEEEDSYGTTSMDLAELEEMEDALDEDELEEEEKVFNLQLCTYLSSLAHFLR